MDELIDPESREALLTKTRAAAQRPLPSMMMAT